MKCHFVKDKDGNKILIPGCYGTVHSNDIEDCCCLKAYKETKEDKFISIKSNLLIFLEEVSSDKSNRMMSDEGIKERAKELLESLNKINF